MKNIKRENLDSFSAMAAYGERNLSPDFLTWKTGNSNYSYQDALDNINGTSLSEKINMSRHFYKKDGYYQRVILHYASFLKWSGILIPNVVKERKISDSIVSKKYYQALDYLDTMNLKNFLAEVALRVFIDGTYYGIQINPGSKDFQFLTLPTLFCRSSKINLQGEPIVEFDVSYFSRIKSKVDRKITLDSYPKEVVSHYKLWTSKRDSNPSPWVILPEEISICFRPYGIIPPFLSVIPRSLQYDETILRNAAREEKEIREILIQHIPHLSTGDLLLEPPEAEELHKGLCDMLRHNRNTDVVTSYGDITLASSNASSEAKGAQTIERIQKNIYSQAGAPAEVFSPTGSSSTALSLQNDLSFVMRLANACSHTISTILNNKFGNGNINFAYNILSVSWYNEKDFVDRHYKMASSGYSLLIPAIASGISQQEFVSLKNLENDLLGIKDILIPFSTAFNTSETSTGGREEKELGERSDKTEINRSIIDEGGEK